MYLTTLFRSIVINNTRCLSFSSPKLGLMEFFDEPQNWHKKDIRHGREWQVEDLRIKSNEDIHKLWFVLYKELNMLMTMEHEYKRLNKLFPAPERIDKVKEGMKNIESVVFERNESYHLLERGISHKRQGEFLYHPVGVRVYRENNEWPIPKEINNEELAKGYKEFILPDDPEVKYFWPRLKEKHITLRIRASKKRRKLTENIDQITKESSARLNERLKQNS